MTLINFNGFQNYINGSQTLGVILSHKPLKTPCVLWCLLWSSWEWKKSIDPITYFRPRIYSCKVKQTEAGHHQVFYWITTLMSFLGLVNYFWDIRNHSTHAHHLHDMVSTAKKQIAKMIIWTGAGRIAFKTLKDLVNEWPKLFFIKSNSRSSYIPTRLRP